MTPPPSFARTPTPAGGAGTALSYGTLSSIYARATAFLVAELVRRGMTREAAERQALEMVLRQAGAMVDALAVEDTAGGV